MALIEVRNLVKVYAKDVVAVDDISFDVIEGEIFGFLGPNGAGKTTTIRVLVTRLEPTGGRAVVDGFEVTEAPTEVRRRIGYAAQFIGIDDDLTGRENLILQGRLHGLSAKAAASEADHLLGVIDLTQSADRRAGTYSGGMRKRLDLAEALVHRPRLLFLDEPTTGLDPQNRKALWVYLRALNDEGITIFLTTQYLEEADTLADRLAIIDHGKLVAEGTPAELKAGVGGDAITVTLAPDAAESEKAMVAEALRSIGDVIDVQTLEGSVVVVYLADGGSRISEVVRTLDAKGVTPSRLAMSEPTLDEVFLQHTGERLRVEEVKQQRRVGFGGRKRRS